VKYVPRGIGRIRLDPKDTRIFVEPDHLIILASTCIYLFMDYFRITDRIYVARDLLMPFPDVATAMLELWKQRIEDLRIPEEIVPVGARMDFQQEMMKQDGPHPPHPRSTPRIQFEDLDTFWVHRGPNIAVYVDVKTKRVVSPMMFGERKYGGFFKRFTIDSCKYTSWGIMENHGKLVSDRNGFTTVIGATVPFANRDFIHREKRNFSFQVGIDETGTARVLEMVFSPNEVVWKPKMRSPTPKLRSPTMIEKNMAHGDFQILTRTSRDVIVDRSGIHFDPMDAYLMNEEIVNAGRG